MKTHLIILTIFIGSTFGYAQLDEALVGTWELQTPEYLPANSGLTMILEADGSMRLDVEVRRYLNLYVD